MVNTRRRLGMGALGLACAWGAGVAQTASPALDGVPQFSPRPRPTRTSPATAAQAAAPLPATAQQLEPPVSSPPAQAAAQLAVQDVSPAAASPAQDASGRRELTNDIAEPFYILRPGDTVDITFRYTPEFNDEVVIGPDGRASLKSAGVIRLAGRTLPELHRLIVSGSTDRLVNPELTVSLKDFERPHVVVAGEVANPQRIELRRPTTVLQAILLAGGPKDDAALGRVLLFRRIDAEDAEVHVLHLGKYDGKTRAQNDLRLEPNDMILVRHDKIERIDRIVKLANLGVYFNPIGNNGIF